MDRNFELAANGWISQYSADVKEKVENLLSENESTPEELAEVINVNVEEIYDILEGNGEDISIETLIKVFMTLGLAVEIKPIEDTPLGGYGNVNPHVMREPRQNPFVRTRPPRESGNPQMPHLGHFMQDVNEEHHFPHFDRMGRGMSPQMPFLGHFGRNEEPQHPSSPFATMRRDELKKIICNKLWDSEIDVNNASDKELVRFLEEKDRRMKEVMFKEREHTKGEDLERDPNVAEFVKRMKKNIKDNPQFRSYMKNFLNKLDEE